MRIIILIINIFIVHTALSQDYVTLENASEEALEAYNAARELSRRNQYEKAIKAFEKTLKKTPNFIDALLYLADSHYALNQFKSRSEF